MRLGTTEIILIVVLALVLFGGGKLAGLGKALGQSIKDFKKEIKESKDEQAPQVAKSEEKDDAKV
ncbi:MAG: twin-arginine translocase TatA/TatE family subunit [Clostridia bacterium]